MQKETTQEKSKTQQRRRRSNSNNNNNGNAGNKTTKKNTNAAKTNQATSKTQQAAKKGENKQNSNNNNKASNTKKNNSNNATQKSSNAQKNGQGQQRRGGGRKQKPLKIIPLGGMGEIGKNMTVFEYGNDLIVVDCGVTFPDGELLGIDYVIPDAQYLQENKEKFRALVITHGHEDHIGGIPFIIKDYKNVPIYAPKLASALIEHKFEERNIKGVHMQVVKAGDKIKAGCFEVSFLQVRHSIADSMALVIKTPVGTIVHTGDFKIDHTPLDDQKMDMSAFAKVGDKGVLLLMSDSTNAERPGYTMSEQRVSDSFESLFEQAKGRIIVATFSSNISRIQQVVKIAEKSGRKVFFAGRSIERISQIAMDIGYLKMKKGTQVDDRRLDWLEPNEVVIITTGSQGEPMSGLVRMATDEHRTISIHEDDMVIISASPIPGNEKNVSGVIDKLYQKGANVIYEGMREVHVSGHACQEEQKMMIALIRPKFFMPVHGEFRHLRAHAKTAEAQGISPNNIVTTEVGGIVEVTRRSIKLAGEIPNSGVVFVDGSGVGDVGSVVLKDRRVLSEDGLLVAIAAVNKKTGELMSEPDIISRGFVYVRENEKMMAKARSLVKGAVKEAQATHKKGDWNDLKTAMRSALRSYLYKETGRRPMILPIVVEI